MSHSNSIQLCGLSTEIDMLNESQYMFEQKALKVRLCLKVFFVPPSDDLLLPGISRERGGKTESSLDRGSRTRMTNMSKQLSKWARQSYRAETGSWGRVELLLIWVEFHAWCPEIRKPSFKTEDTFIFSFTKKNKCAFFFLFAVCDVYNLPTSQVKGDFVIFILY